MPEHDLLAPTVLGAVARRKRLTALVVVAFALLGLLYSLSQSATATASASFVVAQPANTATDANFVNDQVSIIEFRSTADAAAKLLKQAYPTSTLTGVDVLADEKVLGGTTSNLITVQFSNADPALAQAGANALVKAYTNLNATTAAADLQARSGAIQATITKLTQQLASAGGPNTILGAPIAAARAEQIASLSQLQSGGGSAPTVVNSSSAGLPTASRSLAPVAGLILGGIVGLIPAIALAYVLAQTRRKFTDRFQPELLLQRQLLSEIPEFVLEGLGSDVPAADAPHSSSAEAFRFVSTALDDRAEGEGPLIVAVSGGSSLDGKTTVAANLAVTFARRGLRTVAVDADLDGHGLGFLLLGEKRHAPGLAEVLAGRVTLATVIQHAQQDIDPDLRVLPAGLLHGPAITDLVSKASVRRALGDLGQEADVIVLDVPSPLQVAYASSMLAAVGRCLVVVPHGSSPGKLQEFSVRIVALGVDAIGYVYTKAPLRRELGQLSRYVTDKRRVPFSSDDEAPREARLVEPRRRNDALVEGDSADTAPVPAAAAPVAAGVAATPAAQAVDWKTRFANAANELHGEPMPNGTDVLPFYLGDSGVPAQDGADDGDSLSSPRIAVNLIPEHTPVEQRPFEPVGAFLPSPSDAATSADRVADSAGPTPSTAAVGPASPAAEAGGPREPADSESADLSTEQAALVAAGQRVRKRTRKNSWATSDQL